jgi:hypothetical protein
MNEQTKADEFAHKIVKKWAAFTTTDEVGWPKEFLGVFDTEDEANTHAEGKGWYGGRGHVTEVDLYKIDDQNFVMPCHHFELRIVKVGVPAKTKAERKRELLEKLRKEHTPEELSLLGIK